MGKIVKKSVEKIILNKQKFSLGMKWEFKIEFASDSFGPYHYKFEREDCYFNDGLEDRGTAIFPLQNKKFKNTEIFLETSDIVIAVWERWSLLGWDKTFIDVINIKTEKKYRLFTKEVNLIYNDEKNIIINANEDGVFKTLVLDMDSMKKVSEETEELQSFFKCVYNTNKKVWFLLDFTVQDESEIDEEKKYQNGYFSMKKLSLSGEPVSFNRKKFTVKTKKWEINIWDNSIK